MMIYHLFLWDRFLYKPMAAQREDTIYMESLAHNVLNSKLSSQQLYFIRIHSMVASYVQWWAGPVLSPGIDNNWVVTTDNKRSQMRADDW